MEAAEAASVLVAMGTETAFFPPVAPVKSGIAERTRERTSVFFPLAIVDCLRPFFLSSSSLTTAAFLAPFLLLLIVLSLSL